MFRDNDRGPWRRLTVMTFDIFGKHQLEYRENTTKELIIIEEMNLFTFINLFTPLLHVFTEQALQCGDHSVISRDGCLANQLKGKTVLLSAVSLVLIGLLVRLIRRLRTFVVPQVSSTRSSLTKCYPRIRRRYQHVQRRCHYFVARKIVPISLALSTALILIAFGIPALTPGLIYEEAFVYCFFWVVLYGLAPYMLLYGVIPSFAWVGAVYMLVCVSSSIQQAPLPRNLRPARRYGRPRRGVSPYGTKSAGRIRDSAWGPIFRPNLPTIAERKEHNGSTPVPNDRVPPAITKLKTIPCTGNKPPLFPKKMLQPQQVNPPRPTLKRNEDCLSIDCERSAKRMRRTIVTVQESPATSPVSNFTVSLIHESVDDIGGDFYLSTLQDDSTHSTDCDDDSASLTYSECDSLDDDELYGIDIEEPSLDDEPPLDDLCDNEANVLPSSDTVSTSQVSDPVSIPIIHPRDEDVDTTAIFPDDDDTFPEADPPDDKVTVSDGVNSSVFVTNYPVSTTAPRRQRPPPPMEPSNDLHTGERYGSMYVPDNRYPLHAVVRRSRRTADQYKPGMYKV